MMYDPSSFLRGFGLALALIVAIGAQNAFVLRQGLRREHVWLVVAFCVAADVALITAGVAGLGAALGERPGLTRALAFGGVVYLGAYGLAALRRATRAGDGLMAEERAKPLSRGGVLLRGAGFTLLNPHVYLDTVLLMGAVGAALAPVARVSFVAGAGMASAVWFTALGFGARLLAPLFARPGAWRVLDGGVGVVMLVLAGALWVSA